MEAVDIAPDVDLPGMTMNIKPSQAMLKGWEAVGRQCYRDAYTGDSSKNPAAVCALGAYRLGAFGDASKAILHAFEFAYKDKYFVTVSYDNDINKLAIPQIAERLKAIGY